MTVHQILAIILVLTLAILLRKRLKKWFIKRRANMLLQKMQEGDFKKEPSQVYVAASTKGFSIRNRYSDDCIDVEWKEIDRITAFKKDFFVYNCVCVAFELIGGRSVEINESMDGFVDAMEHVAENCDGCIEFYNWYMKITVPAFEAKVTELYCKQDAMGELLH